MSDDEYVVYKEEIESSHNLRVHISDTVYEKYIERVKSLRYKQQDYLESLIIKDLYGESPVIDEVAADKSDSSDTDIYNTIVRAIKDTFNETLIREVTSLTDCFKYLSKTVITMPNAEFPPEIAKEMKEAYAQFKILSAQISEYLDKNKGG